MDQHLIGHFGNHSEILGEVFPFWNNRAHQPAIPKFNARRSK